MDNQNLTVITSFPAKQETHSAATVGVASYTKQILVGHKKYFPNIEISVLAEVLEKPSKYIDEGIEVDRVWHRHNVLSLVKLWRKGIRASETIFISFEAYMFGSLFEVIWFLLGVTVWKLMGKQIVFLVHQVPRQFSFISGLKQPIFRLGSKILWVWVQLLGRVVVFESALKKSFFKPVVVVPHFIPEVKIIADSKAQLGISNKQKIALYFGYIAPYKGIDWLVKNWPDTSEYQLIIAGGINPNHKNNVKISSFINQVIEDAANKKIVVTGFIPEEKIPLYFSAADVVVLPYTEFMSSSGPLSLAIAYNRPILLSKDLIPYQESPDFKLAIRQAKFETSDVYFERNTTDLLRVLKKVETNTLKFDKFCSNLRETRSLEGISKELHSLL